MGQGRGKENSHVMISYSHAQKSIAHRIANVVRDVGYAVCPLAPLISEVYFVPTKLL